MIGPDSTNYVKYVAIGTSEPVIAGYSNVVGKLGWAITPSGDMVQITSELSYPKVRDYFEVNVPITVAKEGVLVRDTQFLPRFIITALWIDPALNAINLGGKTYYFDSIKVPFGWTEFLWKRDYIDAKAVFLTGQGERVIDGRRYLELGGQRNYYASSSGLLILIVYDYTLVDTSSGTSTRMAGKLVATESSTDLFPWKGQMRWLAVLAVSLILLSVTLARVSIGRKAARKSVSLLPEEDVLPRREMPVRPYPLEV